MKNSKKSAGIITVLVVSTSVLMSGVTFASEVGSTDVDGTYYTASSETPSSGEKVLETTAAMMPEETGLPEESESEPVSETGEPASETETTEEETTAQEQTEEETNEKSSEEESTSSEEETTEGETSPEDIYSPEEDTYFEIGEDMYEDIGVVYNSKPDRFGTLYWPLPSAYGLSAITSGYGHRSGTYSGMHAGIDIGAPEGTPVYACEDGIVLESYFSESAGNFTIIQHEDGLYTEYMHQSVRYVKKGDVVKAGQLIGLVGNTGWSTGPHLHIGLVISDEGYSIYHRVDPTPYLTLMNKLDPSVRIITQQELIIDYADGERITNTAEAAPELISRLAPILTRSKITGVSFAGFAKAGFIESDINPQTAEEVAAVPIKKGYDRYDESWIKYEGEKYDIKISLDASYNNTKKACPVAFRLDTVGFVVNRPVYVKDNLKKVAYKAIKDQPGNYFAVGLHVEVYKHGTEERIDLPEVYQAEKDLDHAQAYRCLNETFSADNLFIKNAKAFNTNVNNNKKKNKITATGDLYSDFAADPLKEIDNPGTADVYRKTEKLSEEGLNLVYGFAHDEFESINFYIPQYTLSFNTEKGGKVSTSSETVLSGTQLAEKVLAKAKKGYMFKGWVTDQDVIFADAKLKAGEPITMEQIREIIVTDNLSFTAQFQKQKTKKTK